MRKFDCLSSEAPLLGPHILEASAGTGKTFSIEHIFVRLLLEEIELEHILVMTFTRAATRELKNRIRANIGKAISFLEQGDLPWDYLKSIQNPKKSLRILSDAYALFDRAQIFTIHSFCYRMLKQFAFEAELGFSMPHPDGQMAIPKKIWRAALQFIKEGISPELLSIEQLGLILKKYDSLEELAEVLLLPEGAAGFCFADSWKLYRDLISSWDGEVVEEEKLREDFQKTAPNYKATIKGDFERQIVAIAASFKFPEASIHFRQLLREKGSLFHFFHPTNRKVKYKEPASLHYPLFFSWSVDKISPLVEEATKEKNLISTLREGWQKIARPILDEEAWFSPDEILNQMGHAIEKESFVSAVAKPYRALMVDEFQDTDRLQWDIFSTLFLKKNPPLDAFYLVGDPKQSIYRFRKADVYTYFKARELLGREALYCLDTNFRSSKKLISALNALFARDWLPLPQLQQMIPSYPVFAGAHLISPFNDQKGEIHFILSGSEGSSFEEYFLPFAIHEIEQLIRDQPSFGSYAILVKDRHQARFALELCLARGIPAVAKSHTPIGKTLAFVSLRELFKAIVFFEDLSMQRIVQSGPFRACSLFDAREHLKEGSLIPFFRKLRWESSDLEFEKDMRQLIEELLTWEGKSGFSFEGLLSFFKELEKLDPSEGGNRHIEGVVDAVQILTLHISKGLEFDVVFALGLASRTPEAEEVDELDAEKLRQLYVAMTRAKLRLYVPVVFSEKKARTGGLSPMELFTQTLESQEGAFSAFLQKLTLQESVTFETLDGPFILPLVLPGLKNQESRIESLVPPIFKSSSLVSFTSLSQPHIHTDSEPQPKEFTALLVEAFTSHTIPKGKETGIVIHRIFERLFSIRNPSGEIGR